MAKAVAKREPNQKVLREDLQEKQVGFERLGWKFQPNPIGTFDAEILDDQSVLTLKDVSSVETLFDYIAQIESAKSDGWIFGHQPKGFFAENKLTFEGFYPTISSLLAIFAEKHRTGGETRNDPNLIYPPELLAEKERLEKEHEFVFDYSEEKGEWSAGSPLRRGAENVNSLERLIGILKRRIAEDEAEAEMETAKAEALKTPSDKANIAYAGSLEKYASAARLRSEAENYQEKTPKQEFFEALEKSAFKNSFLETEQSPLAPNDFISPEVYDLARTSRFISAFVGMTREEIKKAAHNTKNKKKLGVTEETEKLYTDTGYALAAVGLAEEMAMRDAELLFNQAGTFTLRFGLSEQSVNFHYCANYSYGHGTQAHFEFWTDDEKTPMPLSETGYRSSFPANPLDLNAADLSDYVQKIARGILREKASGKKEKQQAEEIEILDILFARTIIREGHKYREALRELETERAGEENNLEFVETISADSPKEQTENETLPSSASEIVPMTITAEDGERLQRQMIDSWKAVAEQKARLEKIKKEVKVFIDFQDGETERLMNILDTGIEHRREDCRIVYDAESLTRVLIHPQTGEQIEDTRRRLSDREVRELKQGKLPLI